MRRLSLYFLLLAIFALPLVGCGSSAGEVSETDAANFSKTPDGKDDGRDEANQNR